MKIINYHFTYFEDELDEMEKAIIELENGIYITEKNYGPIGLTNIDLQIMNKVEFLIINKLIGLDRVKKTMKKLKISDVI